MAGAVEAVAEEEEEERAVPRTSIATEASLFVSLYSSIAFFASATSTSA